MLIMAHCSRTTSLEELDGCSGDQPLEGGVRSLDIRKEHIVRGMPKRKKVSFCASTVKKSPKPKQVMHTIKNSSSSVLENRETSQIPVGPRLKSELKKIGEYSSLGIKYPSLESKKHKEFSQPVALPDSGKDVLGQPELHTTLCVAKALEKAKQANPNVTKLLRSKLDSPNTAARLKKKTAYKVTVGPRKKLYQDLVAVDVNEESLVNQLEQQLNVRAETVHSVSRLRYPEPQISDYFNPEDFVRTKKIVQNIPSSHTFSHAENRDRLMIYNCLYDRDTY